MMVQNVVLQNRRSVLNLAIRPSVLKSRRVSSCASFTPVHSLRTAVRRQSRRFVASASSEGSQASSTAATAEEIAPFRAITVTEENWDEEVIKSPIPVFVDFWAPWCGPCRMLGPTIDELIDEFGDRFKAVKVNTDQSTNIATQLGIRSIPTCMVFKNGKKVESVIGAVKKQVLRNSIEKYLV